MSSGWTTLDSFAGFVMRSSAAHAWSVCTKIDYPRCRWQASARDDERAWTLTGRGRSPIDRVARAPSRLAPLRGGTRLDRREDLADELVQCRPGVDPPDDHDEVVVAIHVHDVLASAAERETRFRCGRKRLSPGVQEPVRVTILGVRAAGGACHLQPLFRNDLPVFPSAVAQDEIAEPRHVPRVDEHASAPVAATAHRLHLPAVELDPAVLLAAPVPRA